MSFIHRPGDLEEKLENTPLQGALPSPFAQDFSLLSLLDQAKWKGLVYALWVYGL